MFRTRILGTGSYLPEKVLTNSDLEKLVETNDEWIRDRTGIRTRHIASPEQATSDLALEASRRALEAAKLTPRDLDLIIVATVSPDHMAPNTACLLQQKLGTGPIPAFDLNAACTGFIYAATVAAQFVRTGAYKNVLVIGAETLSRIVNYQDRETCILFGDGAGAAVIGRSREGDKSDFLAFDLGAEGELHHLFEIPAGGSRIPVTHEIIDQRLHFARMRGKEIFKNAIRTMTSSCQNVLAQAGMSKEALNWVIPHQANQRIIEGVAKYLDAPMDKVVVTVDETGNTSAATVPYALDVAVRDGRIQRDQYVLLTGFGAGLTSGSLLLRY